jgi:hypothetical protein
MADQPSTDERGNDHTAGQALEGEAVRKRKFRATVLEYVRAAVVLGLIIAATILFWVVLMYLGG